MSKRKVIRETDKEKLRRKVKDVKAIGRSLAQPKPTLVEKTKKRVSRQQQKIKDKKEIEC
jgi:hypothetical protein